MVKVETANGLYENIVHLAIWADSEGIAWCTENLSNSHMWETKWFKQLRKLKWDNSLRTPYVRSQFQNCMHGGERPQKTTLLNAGINGDDGDDEGNGLSSLEAMCNGNHCYKP